MVTQEMLPGGAAVYISGHAFFAVQGTLLSRKTGAPVTALPQGINIVTFFAFCYDTIATTGFDAIAVTTITVHNISVIAGFNAGLNKRIATGGNLALRSASSTIRVCFTVITSLIGLKQTVSTHGIDTNRVLTKLVLTTIIVIEARRHALTLFADPSGLTIIC